MATSIFFTESKDFKLIKERILNQEDIYLVYVFADTTNIRIPKELIKELPVYGNNLIWVDTADMDFTDISNHIILTIGQLMDPEEEISFYIVSRTSKMEKTVFFLRNQGIPVEIIGPEQKSDVSESPVIKGKRGKTKKAVAKKEPVKEKTRGPGRPKKEKPAITVEAIPEVQKKKGRPKKEKEVPVEIIEKPVKKRGRQKKVKEMLPESVEQVAVVTAKKGRKGKVAASEKPEVKKGRKKSAAKKAKPEKELKARKPRVDKILNSEEIDAKVASFPSTDPNVEPILRALVPVKKVARPKLTGKLIEMIKGVTAEDDSVAEQILNQLVEIGFVDASGGRLTYKD